MVNSCYLFHEFGVLIFRYPTSEHIIYVYSRSLLSERFEIFGIFGWLVGNKKILRMKRLGYITKPWLIQSSS